MHMFMYILYIIVCVVYSVQCMFIGVCSYRISARKVGVKGERECNTNDIAEA